MKFPINVYTLTFLKNSMYFEYYKSVYFVLKSSLFDMAKFGLTIDGYGHLHNGKSPIKFVFSSHYKS